MRRVGVLLPFDENDPEVINRVKQFRLGMRDLDWIEGRSVLIDFRFTGGNSESISRGVTELIKTAPEVIVSYATPGLAAVRRATSTIPIVFVATTDPVGSGIAQSLAQPGGNATGFTTAEFGMSGKWLELLKDLAPNIKRVAVLQDPTSGSSSIAQFAAIQTVGPSLGVDLVSLPLQQDRQIKEVVTGFARSSNTGLIATRTAAAISHRDLIIDLAARLRLPTVYPLRLFVTAGGLAAYGPDIVEEYRQAASYVNRILKGEKPGELPIQAPTKYELVLNLKTAKALGLEIPPAVLARADEVIE